MLCPRCGQASLEPIGENRFCCPLCMDRPRRMKRGGEWEPQPIWTLPSPTIQPTYPPDYSARMRLMKWTQLSANPTLQALEMRQCKESVVRFVNFWCTTYDPRKADGCRDIPMDLYAIQMEFLLWLNERLRQAERTGMKAGGVCKKSRERGVTWLAVYFATHEWLYSPGFAAGFGSLKKEEVDQIGNMNTILEKVRYCIRKLPRWMVPKGYEESKHATQYKIINPENGASIVGEGGEEMGRGGRTSIFFVDEAGHVKNAKAINSALAATTNCRIDMSTPHGAGGDFFERCHSGAYSQFNPSEPQDESALFSMFTMHWRDDPTMNDKKAAAIRAEIGPVNWAEQYEIDFSASLEGVCIPALWVRAAVDFKLPPRLDDDGNELPDASPKEGGLDCSGEGDNNTVLTSRRGPQTDWPVAWKKLDTTQSAHRATDEGEKLGVVNLKYDVSGLGIGYKSAWKASDKPTTIKTHAINSGSAPTDTKWPDGKTSKELFVNLRIEHWWTLRIRFEKTFEYLSYGVEHPRDEMISIPNHPQLIQELSQPLYEVRETGKKQLESKKAMRKRGVASPDYADSLVLAFAQTPKKKRMVFWG